MDVKEFQLIKSPDEIYPLIIRKDGMVNATHLCHAMGKKFNDYERNKQTQVYLQALQTESGIPDSKFIMIKRGGDMKTQGTWIHRLIAIDLARWGFPPFAVQITKWIDELLTTGKVELKRPSKLLVNLTQADVDAEKMEMEYDATQHSNRCCLYIAYIGNGLIKVGYSDCRLLQREGKHMSCESEYPQFRLIGSFEISSRLIETQIHSLLSRWRIAYKNQKEIYKIDSNLQSFLDRIKALLEEHDLQLQISRYKIENLQLKNILLEKDKEILELKNKMKELEI